MSPPGPLAPVLELKLALHSRCSFPGTCFSCQVPVAVALSSGSGPGSPDAAASCSKVHTPLVSTSCFRVEAGSEYGKFPNCGFTLKIGTELCPLSNFELLSTSLIWSVAGLPLVYFFLIFSQVGSLYISSFIAQPCA